MLDTTSAVDDVILNFDHSIFAIVSFINCSNIKLMQHCLKGD